MSKFKVNDWVLDDEDDLFQITRVRDDEIALCDEPYYVQSKEFRLWTPKENEWCWFNMEPFVGNLPNFIKSKTK